MKAALTKKAESLRGRHAHAAARQEHPPRRHRRATATGDRRALPRRRDARRGARDVLDDQFPDLQLRRAAPTAATPRSSATSSPRPRKRVQEAALQQNITTLRNRVNELGVAEPVIQQQGADRIVVQLPGVQDTAQGQGHPRPHRDARDAHGRREQPTARAARRGARAGAVRHRALRRAQRRSRVVVKKQVVLTGDEPHRRAARLRQPDAASRRCTSTLDAHGRAHLPATSRARTSASAWRSCCSRRARARSSPRR